MLPYIYQLLLLYYTFDMINIISIISSKKDAGSCYVFLLCIKLRPTSVQHHLFCSSLAIDLDNQTVTEQQPRDPQQFARDLFNQDNFEDQVRTVIFLDESKSIHCMQYKDM